jgi:hypothetical protein
MCTDLGPSIQEKCHAKILPALMGAMDDFQHPRVQVGWTKEKTWSEACHEACLPSDGCIDCPHLVWTSAVVGSSKAAEWLIVAGAAEEQGTRLQVA